MSTSRLLDAAVLLLEAMSEGCAAFHGPRSWRALILSARDVLLAARRAARRQRSAVASSKPRRTAGRRRA
jgi:hypothetical protein